MPTFRSHTHWQAPQADTQTKACQRVCLPNAEKKKLKIPFPSKNFKNATARATLTTKPTTDKTSQLGGQERQHLTAVWRNGGRRGKLNSCASIKVSAWLTVKCFEIATFG